MSAPVPVAVGLWTDGAEPQLIGGRHRVSGEIVFPMPQGDAAQHFDAVALSRTGSLWSWTSQDFRPKSPPYAGPEAFKPFLIGYVELPGQVIVETRIEGAALADLKIGMAMEMVLTEFAPGRSTFAFKPAGAGA
ncbi:MAG: OB-fold domain-containing protein [Blastomonas sp.]|uniref:Zn-ribbon domain-containing OB-fold protein n=1 Tax=Blastomonas sp. TaxID=1909299 RepID=UPI00258D35E8|nr:OB-fold domain-containing protein [Blastomonas sp.]MCO5791691.1 OB-fold domain-containing protein [Blastomonas sp.]